jgi:hypothetical protein
LYIESETLLEYINGNVKLIQVMFRRIDRFVKMITFESHVTDFNCYRKTLPVSKINHLNEKRFVRRGQSFLLKTNITNKLMSFRVTNPKSLNEISEAINTVDFVIHSLAQAIEQTPKQVS